MKTIFEQYNYKVCLDTIFPPQGGSYTFWLVSDGIIQFSLGYEPTLTLEGVKEEVRLYRLEKQDEVTKHEK